MSWSEPRVRLSTKTAMEGLDSPARRQLIGRALYGKRARKDYVPTDLHQAIADVPAARGPQGLTVVTLNYYDLIERAYDLRGLPVGARSNANFAGEADVHTIHHVHGLLGTGRRQGSLYVVTESDYHRSRTAAEDWRSGLIGEAAETGPIVFIGTSAKRSQSAVVHLHSP